VQSSKMDTGKEVKKLFFNSSDTEPRQQPAGKNSFKKERPKLGK
jgi:hypothetical protein